MADLSPRTGLLIVAVAAGVAAITAFATVTLLKPTQAYSNTVPNDWLLAAASDEERFRRLQQQLRGLDQPMWEVGERYRRIHESLLRENYDLALYHWDKIGLSIRNGIAKRPARVASAEALFLGPVFDQITAGLKTRDSAQAWAAFESAKAACQSCHQAEKVEHMDRQPMFDLMPPSAATP